MSRNRPAAAAGAAAMLALACAAALAAPAGKPALPRAPTAGAKPAPIATLPTADATPLAIAREARLAEESGAYGRATDLLRALRGRVGPDVDLEIALALDEARAGMLDSAWIRLQAPRVEAALMDTLPYPRRTDYPWEREHYWIDARFAGWHWYIVRARAEIAARLGRWEEARRAARAAVEARPLAGREWLILAVCAGRAGDEAEAAAAAARAAFLDRSLPEAQYLHALHEWRAGRRAAAQAGFRAAIELDPGYREPALALVRSRLPSAAPDSLPAQLLHGRREIGLLTSPQRPKLDEFVAHDVAPKLQALVNPTVPDSLRGSFPDAELALSILIDERGQVVLHELPWYEPRRFPAPMVSQLTAGLRDWRFEPARRHGEPILMWATIQVSIRS